MKRSILTISVVLGGLIAAGLVADASAQRRSGPPVDPLPTVEEMANAIDATAEQRAILAEARLDVQQNMDPARQQQRVGQGQRNPAMGFLVAIAPSLDTSEMITVVDLITGHRAEMQVAQRGNRYQQNVGCKGSRHGHAQAQGHRQGKGGGHGDCRSGQGQGNGRGQGQGHGRGQGQGQGQARQNGGHDQMIQQLDLTSEQLADLEVVNASTSGALRALKKDAAGAEPSQVVLDEAQRLRDEHQARVEAIVGPEQWTRLEELRDERRYEKAVEADDRATARIAQHKAQLTTLLDLSDAQVAQLETIIVAEDEKRSDRRLRHWESGGPMAGLFDGGHGKDEAAKAARRDEVRKFLEPDQRELFAKVQALSL